MKLLFEIFLIAHGLLHLPAFVRTFFSEPTPVLEKTSTKVMGVLWLTAALLFFYTAGLFHYNNNYWWMASFLAIVVSQLDLITRWKETKSGTIVNLVIAMVTYAVACNLWQLQQN
jgi:hypothetical protein